MDSTTALWLVVSGSILATYFWRFLGALFSSRIAVDGALFEWITCVSYAMLAGLIARMILIPVGPLVETGTLPRVLGVAAGLAVYFATGKRILPGVAAGLAVFVSWIVVTT